MAYVTIHRMNGSPSDLMARKRATFDLVTRQHAPRHGAILSATVPTDDGILVINVGESRKGAAALTREPAMRDA